MFYNSSVLMLLMTVWTSSIGLVTCSFVFGFFNSASSPTVNECILILAGPEWFNFGIGQAIVFMGIGAILGAPAAGSLQYQF